jgi:hypothetical protein
MKKGILFGGMAILPIVAAIMIFGACQPYEEWAMRYDGPTHFIDQSYSLGTDASGNVYVTGLSWGIAADSDIVTIKYDNGGDKVWEVVYDGPAHSSELNPQLAVDSAGNVYLAATTNYDIVTMKYDTDGNQIWARIYGDDIVAGQEERAYEMTIDGDGNVYVVGKTEAYTFSDYLTLKYDNNGILKWVAKYDGPLHKEDTARDIAVDAAGNVYVTGGSAMRMVDCLDIWGEPSSCVDTDWATVKYDSDGNQVWVKTFNGPVDGPDSGMGVAVDSSENVVVTGMGYMRFGLPDPGYPDHDEDIFTIKYDGLTGNEIWIAQYSGPIDSLDRARDILVDANSNVFVVGLSTKEMVMDVDDPVNLHYRWDCDYLAIKYYDNGPGYTEEWVTMHDGLGHNYDEAIDAALDVFGNVYLTGMSFEGATGLDCTTVGISSAGQELWVKSYNGFGDGYDVGHMVSVDPEGNVYVAGYGEGSGTNYDYLTIKYCPYLAVQIDVKPGAFPNVINLKSKGLLPVAIISTANFDAASIDPLTITLEGAGIALAGNPMVSLEDISGDGLLDLIVHFRIQQLSLSEGSIEAVLNGQTFGGICIKGADSVVVVNPGRR